MALALRKPISDVSYHTSVLVAAKAIEEVDSRPVRGAVEHFYRATQRNEVTDEEYAAMSPESRQDFDLGALQFAVAEAGAALDAGTMTARADHCIARIPGEVDEEGWERLNAIYKRTYEEVFAVIEQSANRFADDPTTKRIAVSNLLTFFELPGPTRCALPEDSLAD
jgi:hypothetical protein